MLGNGFLQDEGSDILQNSLCVVSQESACLDKKGKYSYAFCFLLSSALGILSC